MTLAGNVIDINAAKSHLSGEATCIACGHEWVCVAPVGVFKEMECPKCGAMKGLMKHGVMPESFWECDCGCYLFTVSGISGDIMCWQCGEPQRWD
jgi:hypothetical protein